MYKALTALFLLFTFVSAHAQEAKPFDKLHLGVALGSYMDGTPYLDDGSGFIGKLGLEYDQNWSVEAEISKVTLEAGGFESEVTLNNLFAIYRSEGTFYYMGKVGMVGEYVEAALNSPKQGGVSLGYGFGGGFRINDLLSIEADFTVLEPDLSVFGITTYFDF